MTSGKRWSVRAWINPCTNAMKNIYKALVKHSHRFLPKRPKLDLQVKPMCSFCKLLQSSALLRKMVASIQKVKPRIIIMLISMTISVSKLFLKQTLLEVARKYLHFAIQQSWSNFKKVKKMLSVSINRGSRGSISFIATGSAFVWFNTFLTFYLICCFG